MATQNAEAGKENTETGKAAGDTTITGDEGKTPAAGAKKDEKAPAAKTPEEQKAIDDAAAATAAAALKEKGGKEGDTPKAPDKYELKLPDEAGDFLDDDDLKTVEATARAKGWTNDQAQAAVDEYADGLAKQSAAFREQTEKDPTYGGDNLAETQRLARLALDKVRPANTEQGKAIRRLLVKTGYGNHIAVVGLLADLGKMMGEDTHGNAGGGSASGDKSAADVLYGGTSK